MQITQNDDGKHGLVRLQDGDNSAGEMKYTWAGPTMFIIDSTHVDDAYRGQNVGRTLLDAVVAFAREKNLKVIPLCPFAKAQFDKDASLRDVLREA